MLASRHLTSIFYFSSVFFCGALLIFRMITNAFPIDTGDGLMHYYIAEATWYDPIYFIDHWGKPLFNLLASPFAQLGINGVVFFNILLFLGSCWIGKRLMTHLKVPINLMVLFPLILVAASDYTMTILAGLTEPLFNLLVLLAALLLVKKKWVFFAVIVSLLPFSRSEGQLPLILALILLIYSKQYKVIPYLAAGFVVYGFIGLILINDFWWYFTTSPYSMDNSIYGVGKWNHYILSYDFYIGQAGLILLLLAIPTLIYFMIKRRWDFVQLEISFFAYGIFIGVVGLHSYFWATGQNGSIGLTRIATQGMPLFLLVHLSYIGRLEWLKSKTAYILSITIALFLGYSLLYSKEYPRKLNTMEKQLVSAQNFIQPYLTKERKLYYHFPFFAYLLNENPYIENDKNYTLRYSTSNLSSDINSVFQKGDFIIWDSHFGPVEAGLKLDLIEKQQELLLVKEFTFGLESVKIFQFVPVSDQIEQVKYSFLKLSDEQFKIDKQNEFTNILPEIPFKNQELDLEFTFYANSKKLDIVFDNGNIEDYYSNSVSPNDSLILKFQIPANGIAKLYIWNPKGIDDNVVLKNCRIKKISYPAVIE